MSYGNNPRVSNLNIPLELIMFNSNSNIENEFQLDTYENNESCTNIKPGFFAGFGSNSNNDGNDSSLNNEKKSDFNIETLKEDTTKEISGLIEKKEEKKDEKKMKKKMEEKDENKMEKKDEKNWKKKWKKEK